MALHAPLPIRLLYVGFFTLVAGVGLLAGIAPAMGVAAAIGVCFATLTINDLAVGVCVYSTVIFVEALPDLFGDRPVAKALGTVLVLSWLATVGYRRRRDGLFREYPLLSILLLLMAAWVSLSAVWASDPGASLVAASTWALNILLVPIVFAALRRPEHLERLFAVFAVGGFLSALAGVAGFGGPVPEGEAGRLATAGGNANQLGGLLIIGTVFSLVLSMQRSRPPAVRGLWVLCATFCGVALALTLSRGALVGLAAALFAAPFVAGRGRRAPLMAAGAVILVGVGLALFALAPADATARLTDDSSGSGRTDIWKVGLRMVEDNPVVGVGAANFAPNTVHYLLAPGVIRRSDFIVDIPKVPHNIYLQALAELGIVGLLLFLAIIGTTLACGLKAAWRFASDGRRDAEMLARGLVIASVGFFVFEFFSSQMYSKALWLLIALGPATLAIAARDSEPLER